MDQNGRSVFGGIGWTLGAMLLLLGGLGLCAGLLGAWRLGLTTRHLDLESVRPSPREPRPADMLAPAMDLAAAIAALETAATAQDLDRRQASARTALDAMRTAAAAAPPSGASTAPVDARLNDLEAAIQRLLAAREAEIGLARALRQRAEALSASVLWIETALAAPPAPARAASLAQPPAPLPDSALITDLTVKLRVLEQVLRVATMAQGRDSLEHAQSSATALASQIRAQAAPWRDRPEIGAALDEILRQADPGSGLLGSALMAGQSQRETALAAAEANTAMRRAAESALASAAAVSPPDLAGSQDLREAAQSGRLALLGLAALSALALALCLAVASRRIARPLAAAAQAAEDLAPSPSTASQDPRGGDIARLRRALDRLRSDQAERQARTAREHVDAAALGAAQDRAVASLTDALTRCLQGHAPPPPDPDLPAALEPLMRAVTAMTDRLSELGAQAADGAARIGAGAAEITAVASDLSRPGGGAEPPLRSASRALDSLGAAMDAAAKSAERAGAAAHGSESKARQGKTVAAEAISAMTEIQVSSDKIANIVGAIEDIAFQTNLLALNAGVEAARAGEAGRGFAIVASEVRGLASRASSAAQDINALISTSGEQVARGADLVRQTREALDEISAGVGDIVLHIDDIASLATGQTEDLAKVSDATGALDRAWRQDAEAARAVLTASQAVAEQAEQLTQLFEPFHTSAPPGQHGRPAAQVA